MDTGEELGGAGGEVGEGGGGEEAEVVEPGELEEAQNLRHPRGRPEAPDQLLQCNSDEVWEGLGRAGLDPVNGVECVVQLLGWDLELPHEVHRAHLEPEDDIGCGESGRKEWRPDQPSKGPPVLSLEPVP